MDNNANITYTLLVEFEFIIDLDFAMYTYIRENFGGSPYLDEHLMNMPNEREIIYNLLKRKHVNPLEIMIPGMDTTDMYYELKGGKFEELIKYARPYDTYKVMITYFNMIKSPMSITVLCDNDIQQEYIKRSDSRFRTLVAHRQNVAVSKYTSIYSKYIANMLEYQYNGIKGKHLYFAAAGFNMEEEKNVVKPQVPLVLGDLNQFHMMDLYTKIKFRFERKGKE